SHDLIQGLTAGWLEIGKLRNLLTVKPHFPAQAPGPESRAFPVILDKANVMLARVNPNRFETFEIALLRVARIWFQDDLQLVVHLHTIRVIPKAAIVRTDAGFHIDHVPGLWTQDTEGRRRIHGPSANLDVVGLLHQATLVLPVGQEAQDNILKAQRRAHDHPSATVSAEGRQLNGGPSFIAIAEAGYPTSRLHAINIPRAPAFCTALS